MDAPSFGKYIIKKLLRQSDREKVYAAVDPAPERPVIIKVLRQPVPPETAGRLAELTAPLHHPHIACLYDIGMANRHMFLVQEDLPTTLAERLAQYRASGQVAPPDEVARQLRLIAGALDHAHSQGIVHGSLNPASILLTELDEPVLADFGLAAVLGSDWTLPAYGSPEQADGQPPTPLSDLYALGLILYEWLGGRAPFSDKASSGKPDDSNSLQLPQAVEQILRQALAKSPAQRFTGAGSLAEAFTSALTEAVSVDSVPVKTGALPEKIGRYEIEAELGRRGNLTVYRARDPKLERQVAIKLLPAQFATDDQLQRHFQREIELIAALEHHAIVQVYDFGEHDGQPFVVMPYLAGGTLELRLRSGSMDPQQFAPMLARIAEALDAAHAQGIIHGQITPGNILFDEQGQAYLSDFALSTLVAASSGVNNRGDLRYMSPEQAQVLVEGASAAPDKRSDIYALGIILFEVLTGQVPYSAGAGFETAKRHLTEPVPLLHSLEPDLGKVYQPLINRALAKNPADRYATATELTRHVREVTSGRWYLASLIQEDQSPTSTVTAQTEADLFEPPPTQASGVSIGRYHIERELGRGGMAVVYLAYDPQLKRRVAIKTLPSQFMELPGFQERFHHEAELVARLQHPAIVSIYDFGESEGQPFIVMQYLSGGTLAERLQQGPLKLPALAPIIERVAAALDEAHAQHIIHHDVKPGNIIFNAKGQAFLSDFGIAVLAEASAALSEKSELGFTPKYVSPERVKAYRDKSSAEVDGRSDVYALGVVLFEALAGRPPFQAGNPIAMGMAHLEAPIPRLETIEPAQAGQKMIERALAKSPAGRYQTAGELAQAVKELASGRWVLRTLLE